MKRIIVAALALGASPRLPGSSAGTRPRRIGPGARVAGARRDRPARFVGAGGRAIPRGPPIASDGARAFLRRHADAFGIRDQAKELRAASDREAPRRALGGALPAGARRRPGARRRADGQSRRRGRHAVRERRDAARRHVAASPRGELGAAARDAAWPPSRRAEMSARARRHHAGALGVRRPADGRPGPEAPTLVWRVEVVGRHRGRSTSSCSSTRGPARRAAASARSGGPQAALDLRREQQRLPSCPAPRRCAPRAARPARSRTSTSPTIRRQHVQLLHAASAATASTATGMPIKSTVRYCDPGAPCPCRTRSGTASRWSTATGFAAPTTWSPTS